MSASELIKFFKNRSQKQIPRGFQTRVRESYQPHSPKKQREKIWGVLARDPPPPCLPCVRPFPRARLRLALRPILSSHLRRTGSQPPSPPARSHAHTPIPQPHPSEITRQHTPVHPLPPSRMRTRTRAHPHARTRITCIHFRVTRPDARTCPRSCVAHTVEVIHRVVEYVKG